MSLTNAINELEGLIEGSQTPNLVKTPDVRDASLAKAGRGKFDSSYSLRVEGGPAPLGELTLNPERWRAKCRVELGGELGRDRLAAQVALIERARQVHEAIVWPGSYTNFNIVEPLPEWILSEVDRRLILSASYNMCYGE